MVSKKLGLVSILLIIILGVSVFLGSIPPSPFYYLKITRETIQTLFIFGDEDRANWVLTKAGKRLEEAEKLRNKKLNFLSDMQIDKAKDYQEEALKLLEGLKDKTDINYLTDIYNSNKDKIKALEGN